MTFEEMLKAARASRGIEPPPAPAPDPEPAWRRALSASIPHVADVVEPAEPEIPQAVWDQAMTEMFGQPGGPLRAPKASPEPYVCRGCRTVQDFSDHDDASYIERKCAACLISGAPTRTRGRNKGLTSWARIRTVPEYQDGEPAGTWRPQPGAMQGMWEKSPDRAAMDAEVARRIATL